MIDQPLQTVGAGTWIAKAQLNFSSPQEQNNNIRKAVFVVRKIKPVRGDVVAFADSSRIFNCQRVDREGGVFTLTSHAIQLLERGTYLIHARVKFEGDLVSHDGDLCTNPMQVEVVTDLPALDWSQVPEL